MDANDIRIKIQKFEPKNPIKNWQDAWFKLIGNADPDDVLECADILANIIADERTKSPVIDFWSEAVPDYFHNTIDYLREQYDGENIKIVEDAEEELEYLYPGEGDEKTVTAGIIARAKQLREMKKKKTKEICSKEEETTASVYEKSLSEKEIDSMLLLMKVIAYNDLDARIEAKGEENCDDVWLENRVILKHGISTDILNTPKLYTLISDHTHMPLICDDFTSSENCMYLCTDKERTEQLAEYRKSAHGEDCSAAEMDLNSLFKYLMIFGYEAVRFVPELSSSIILTLNDLFDALDDTAVYTQNYEKAKTAEPELSISVLKYYQKRGDYKGSSPDENDDLADLSAQMSRLLQTKRLFAPITSHYNDKETQTLPGYNVCAEMQPLNGHIQSICVFYSDLYTLEQRYTPGMHYVHTDLGQLLSALHVSRFLLRVGDFPRIISVSDILTQKSMDKPNRFQN